MKKHLLFMVALFSIATMTFGQIDTITSPFVSNQNSFDWSGQHWQRGATAVFEGLYETTDADSVSIGVMHLHKVSWAGIMSHTVQKDGVNGQAVDGIIQDTLTIPSDFNLTADTAGWYLFQARIHYSSGLNSYSNGVINVVEAYTDSLAVDTVIGVPKETQDQLGQVNLGEVVAMKGHYGIADLTSVEVRLMHMNSSWGTVMESTPMVIYDANTGVKSGHFYFEYEIPSDFNTVADLANGDFFALRVWAAYGDGTNEFSFHFLDVVDLIVNGVELDMNSMMINVGVSKQLTATISPETAEDKSLTWTSSDETIAVVDETGLVTGMAAGEAMIKVVTTDGGFADSCSVMVTPVSVDIDELSKIKTYPNPATDVLNIEGLKGKYNVSVYSILGAKVMELELEGSERNRISVEGLSEGMYIIDIEGKEGRVTRKFNKQ